MPWQLLKDAQGFLSFLGSYSIFMAPICAIMICDYFVVKRGNIHVPSLYNPASGGLYYHAKGWNLVSAGCWVAAMLFGLPGLIGAYEPSLVSEAAITMYKTGWLLTFVTAFVFYGIMAGFVYRPQIIPDVSLGRVDHLLDSSGKLRYEALVSSHGYLDDETPEDLYLGGGDAGCIPVLEGQASDESSQKEAAVVSKELKE